MSALTITTNNVPRPVLRWYDLSAKEQREFDYLDTEDRRDEAEFVRYRNWVYDTHEFMTTRELQKGAGHHDLSAWDGYQSDSFFSGVVLRWAKDDRGEPDWENVIMGTYIS